MYKKSVGANCSKQHRVFYIIHIQVGTEHIAAYNLITIYKNSVFYRMSINRWKQQKCQHTRMLFTKIFKNSDTFCSVTIDQ